MAVRLDACILHEWEMDCDMGGFTSRLTKSYVDVCPAIDFTV